MITLHTFGPAFGLPDPSSFVIKVHVLLKMANLPYTVTRRGFSKSPKRKLPYIVDDGVAIGDSTFIRWHLENKYKIDFNAGLSESQRALAWTIEQMLQEQLYFAALYDRWMIQHNYELTRGAMFGRLPFPLRQLLPVLVRRRMHKILDSQGTARHDYEDIIRLAKPSIDALATFLADKPYMMADHPTALDASAYGVVAALLCPVFETPLLDITRSHANLVSYEKRLKEQFFPS